MTTWPLRADLAIMAMNALKSQQHSEPVHYVLTLSKDEWMGEKKRDSLIRSMNNISVEIIWDDGNIMSHKKLMPTLEKYPDNPILVVDDDKFQQKGWLEQFIQDHKAYPSDIIYGNALVCHEDQKMIFKIRDLGTDLLFVALGSGDNDLNSLFAKLL